MKQSYFILTRQANNPIMCIYSSNFVTRTQCPKDYKLQLNETKKHSGDSKKCTSKVLNYFMQFNSA